MDIKQLMPETREEGDIELEEPLSSLDRIEDDIKIEEKEEKERSGLKEIVWTLSGSSSSSPGVSPSSL